MWGVDEAFQPAQSFQTYKKDEALVRINTAQSEVFSEETQPLDLNKKRIKDSGRKTGWGKKEKGGNRSAPRQTTGVPAASKGIHTEDHENKGKGGRRKTWACIKEEAQKIQSTPHWPCSFHWTHNDKDGLSIWSHPWRAVEELSSLLHRFYWSCRPGGDREGFSTDTEKQKVVRLKKYKDKDSGRQAKSREGAYKQKIRGRGFLDWWDVGERGENVTHHTGFTFVCTTTSHKHTMQYIHTKEASQSAFTAILCSVYSSTWLKWDPDWSPPKL